ncbi:OmpA family protein, partial [Bradyrhizobium sp.]|uniref:OmpA family protein n=1 Tax=Bradyrhizobium sp. TaxID=376 RepID=UPI0025B9B23D
PPPPPPAAAPPPPPRPATPPPPPPAARTAPPPPPTAAPSPVPPKPPAAPSVAPVAPQQKSAPSPVPPPAGTKQLPSPSATPAPTAPTAAPTPPPPSGSGAGTPPPGARQAPPPPSAPPAATAPPTQTTPPGSPPAGAGPGAPPPPARTAPPPGVATPTPTPTPTPGGPTATPTPGAPSPTASPTPGSPPAAGAPTAAPVPGGQTALPSGAPVTRQPPPTVAAPIPAAPPPAEGLKAIPQGSPAQQGGPTKLEGFREQRRETQEGGRTIIREPGRIIIQDPSGRSFIRHNEVDRFRYGARDIQTRQVGNETRTIVIRPDGTQIITVNDRSGQLLRRIRRDPRGREIIIIDNSYRGPRGFGGFYVDLAPPVLRIPQDRYIVEADEASPELLYDTMIAPPVERIERRYSLDEIRYSPSVRQRMPSIDLNSINFETGSWEIPPDQASKLQAIADGLNRAIAANPRAVFLIEGHTDAVGSDVDNLSLSDRRAESAATLLTQQFNVPAENLTSQGYGEQYLKEPTDGPSIVNRRVTIRNITPLLNGGSASLPPPPPGTARPR